MQNAKTFNLIGDEVNFEEALLNNVMEHSHVAADVDLIDKVDEEVLTPFGELTKSSVEQDVKFLKPKTNKHDEEFLNQIAYLQGLSKMVSNRKSSRDQSGFFIKQSFLFS